MIEKDRRYKENGKIESVGEAEKKTAEPILEQIVAYINVPSVNIIFFLLLILSSFLKRFKMKSSRQIKCTKYPSYNNNNNKLTLGLLPPIAPGRIEPVS